MPGQGLPLSPGAHHRAAPAPPGAPTLWAGTVTPPLSSSRNTALPSPAKPSCFGVPVSPGDETPPTARGVQGWHPPNRHRCKPHGVACPTSRLHHPAHDRPGKGGAPGLMSLPGATGDPGLEVFSADEQTQRRCARGWRGGESQPR